MDEVYICERCIRTFEPEEEELAEGGVRKLKTFNGYTVDLRLQQFRKIVYKYPVFGDMLGISLDFVDFASPKGKALLAQMHEQVTR